MGVESKDAFVFVCVRSCTVTLLSWIGECWQWSWCIHSYWTALWVVWHPFDFSFSKSVSLTRTQWVNEGWKVVYVVVNSYRLNLQLPTALCGFLTSFSSLCTCVPGHYTALVHSALSQDQIRGQEGVFLFVFFYSEKAKTPLCAASSVINSRQTHSGAFSC